MFRKILIANRGEIAVRVIRACHELGIEAVAVYSQADKESLHVKLADQAVCIGPPPAKDSYLNIPNIIQAALNTGAEAIHPGYGLLSENPSFAEICEQCNLKFIGPRSEVIAAMGDKAEAKRRMKEAGVPLIPGTEGVLNSDREAFQVAHELGYPLMIKAAAGGGGTGIRIVHNESQLQHALAIARAEAEAAFGNGNIYIEKYLEEPRHVEVQILGDEHGNVIHLGERDCSVQTARHKKMVEESPCSALSHSLRSRLGEAAVRGAKAVGYTNAGTMEFLVSRRHEFYFLEMNTRLQVEHPVTEMVTGVDLVKEQIRIAAGEPLNLRQNEVKFQGHAIECRITAEDASKQFTPSAGEITQFIPPGGPGVRVDSHLYAGYVMPPYYDSLLAKIIVHGRDRQEAILRMERVLAETTVEGVKTTLAYHQRIMGNAFFRRGEISTNFIQRRLNEQ
jgi:acetyl-CoA carboxylase biotin carboxylase subunit